MPSKTSFFNKGIFSNNIKRFWLITFSYSLFLLIFIMGYLFTEVRQFQNLYDTPFSLDAGTDIFRSSSGLMTVFVGFYSLISGLAVFSYMHFPKNTAMIHSLPLRRETLFASNYLSGLFICTFPLIFNSAVLILVEAAYGFPDLSYAFLWLGINLSITFLLYTFTVFAGMFTGHMAAQTIFYLIYNFLAIFLETIITHVLNHFLFGYVSTGYKFQAWSPLVYMTEKYLNFSRDGGSIPVFMGYLIAGLLFLLASHLLYRKRHMEVASDVISFKAVKPIFKYVVAFCSSALLGALLVAVLRIENDFVPYVLVYIFGGFIGYFSSEMLLRKTFKVFNAYKGFIAYAIVLTLLFCSISFDIYGYERYVPQDSEVEMMFMSSYADTAARLALNPEEYDPVRHRYIFDDYTVFNNPPAELTGEHLKELRKRAGVADSREAITKLRAIHHYIVSHASSYEIKTDTTPIPSSVEPVYEYSLIADYMQSRRLYFLYRLKDGRLIERQYQLPEGDHSELNDLLREYLSIPDVAEKYKPILGMTASDIRNISISYTIEDRFESHEIKDIEGFLKAYQTDLSNMDPLLFMYGYYKTNPIYNMSLNIELMKGEMYKDTHPSISEVLSSDFKNTIEFLIKTGAISEEQLRQIESGSDIKFNYR